MLPTSSKGTSIMGLVVLASIAIGTSLMFSPRGKGHVVLAESTIVTAPGAQFTAHLEGDWSFRKAELGGLPDGPKWRFTGPGKDGCVLWGDSRMLALVAPSRPGDYTLRGSLPGWFSGSISCKVIVRAGENAVGPALGLVQPALSLNGGGAMVWGEQPVRVACSVTVLQDGSVLLAGGWLDNGGHVSSRSAFRYWPDQRRVQRVGDLCQARAGQGAALLPDGRVLLLGGGAGPEAEVFLPSRNAFMPVAQLQAEASEHRLCPLPTGEVLDYPFFEPGRSHSGLQKGPVQARLVDGRTLVAQPLGPVQALRERPTLSLLPGGRVLVVGAPILATDPDAEAVPNPSAMTEIYEPSLRALVLGPATCRGRRRQRAVALSDGRVLVLGGRSGAAGSYDRGEGAGPGAMELFDPEGNLFVPAGVDGPAADAVGAVAALPDGQVLLVLDDHPFRIRPGVDGPNGLTAFPSRMAATRAVALPDGRILLLGPSPQDCGLFHP